jgi:glutamate dehydrogenase
VFASKASGIHRKLGLDETHVRKLQTGGPDGDLGPSEILPSEEKYVAIAGGSGVLVDCPVCGRSG